MSTHKGTVPLTCVYCKSLFLVEPYRTAAAKFCSRACAYASRRDQAGRRFWANVDQSQECWTWRGWINHDGYGVFGVDGKSVLAHRHSYQLENGPVASTVFVMHTCDLPSCVRPSHLFAGTHQDNMKDMVKKQRQCRGVTVHTAKLNETQVREIRRRYTAGEGTLVSLGKEFGVDHTVICAIVHRRYWKHVTD